jgi:tetratricopeptide (TPR) repeat protein
MPFQLPPPPRFLTNRRDELAQLGRWLTHADGQMLLAVISGPAGIGKTALALRWLHDVRPQFPDGQLYVDLGAFSGSQVAPEQALEGFLVALGLPTNRLPLGLPQREALFRSLIADRAVALLLDNAMSAAQVRPLLPSSGRSVVLVTSRWRLAGLSIDGARFVDVDPLSVSDSVELLRNLVGDRRIAAEHAQAEVLARLCCGMPIALSVVGARLNSRPRRSVSKEVADLQSRDRFAVLSLMNDELSVDVVFGTSNEVLPPDQARLYQLCAFHPGPTFGVDVVAAMSNQTVDEVEIALDGLVEQNLLIEVGDRRFRYHDLIRMHAQQQAAWGKDIPYRDAAIRGMVEWYLNTMVAVDVILRATRRRVGPRYQGSMPRSTIVHNRNDALRWLRIERENILQAVWLAVEHGWDELVWQLCEALWSFMPYTSNHGEWPDVYQAGASAAARCGHLVAEARLRAQLGSSLTNMHRFDDALRENRRAFELAEQAGDQVTKATALSELASATYGKGDLHAALALATEARNIREITGTVRATAQCQRQVGMIMTDLGNYKEAAAELRRASSSIPTFDIEQARVLTGLGDTYLRWGRLSDSNASLTKALSIVRELGAGRFQADVLVLLGDLAECGSNLAVARGCFVEAHELYEECGDPKVVGVTRRLARLSAN